MFDRFLTAEGIPTGVTALTSAKMHRFSVWLQETTVHARRGDTPLGHQTALTPT